MSEAGIVLFATGTESVRARMRYTQCQVRELLGLPLQTYRYWASAVPHLASRSGKAASFSTGDLLGLQLTGVGGSDVDEFACQ